MGVFKVHVKMEKNRIIWQAC